METMKVKPWGKNQGEFVLIDKESFDPEKHEAVDAIPGVVTQTIAEPKGGEQVADFGLPPVTYKKRPMTMHHKGRGKYDVLDGDGNVVQSGLTKDEATTLVEGD